jgi:hypothetical protein
MARKFKDDDFANLVKRLNELSNASPEAGKTSSIGSC